MCHAFLYNFFFFRISKNGEATHVTESLVKILPLVDILCNCITSERDARVAFQHSHQLTQRKFGRYLESSLKVGCSEKTSWGVGEITD